MNHKFSLIFTLIFILASMLLYQCSTESEDNTNEKEQAYQIQSSFNPDPPVAGQNNQMEVTLVDSQGEPAGSLDVVFKPWMTMMGHGSHPEQLQGKTGNQENVYFTDSLRFTMPGKWDVMVIVQSDQGTDTLRVETEVK